MLAGAQPKKYPVITLVLYFGLKPYSGPRTLLECLDLEGIPEELMKYINDYRIHVVEVAFLPDETVQKFTNDFRTVAEHFTKSRTDLDYQPSNRQFEHVDALLKMMEVLTGDKWYKSMAKQGGVTRMDVILEHKRKEGLKEGQKKERALLAELRDRMAAADRLTEFVSAFGNETEMGRLLHEFGLDEE